MITKDEYLKLKPGDLISLQPNGPIFTVDRIYNGYVSCCLTMSYLGGNVFRNTINKIECNVDDLCKDCIVQHVCDKIKHSIYCYRRNR